ncbi:MAG: DNA glycosylase AlkZ-like family protein [Terriglobales bacterium]
MTSEELLAARTAYQATLRPTALDAETLVAWVATLSFPTLTDLGEEAPALVEAALADCRVAELWLWPGTPRYCHADLLGYVYAAAGDRHPRKDYHQQANRRQLSWLAAAVFTLLLEAPEAMTAAQLRDRMGAERTSALAIEHACHELAGTLKVVRCGRAPGGDPLWRPLLAALPEVPQAIDHISQLQAAAALITHHLETALCVTEAGLAEFFSPLFSRSRIHEAVAGLERARELALDNLEGRQAFRLK